MICLWHKSLGIVLWYISAFVSILTTCHKIIEMSFLFHTTDLKQKEIKLMQSKEIIEVNIKIKEKTEEING